MKLLKQCDDLMKEHGIGNAVRLRIGAELNNQLTVITLEKKRMMKFESMEDACANLLPSGVPHEFESSERAKPSSTHLTKKEDAKTKPATCLA